MSVTVRRSGSQVFVSLSASNPITLHTSCDSILIKLHEFSQFNHIPNETHSLTLTNINTF